MSNTRRSRVTYRSPSTHQLPTRGLVGPSNSIPQMQRLSNLHHFSMILIADEPNLARNRVWNEKSMF
jgi:hypothetical protein